MGQGRKDVAVLYIPIPLAADMLEGRPNVCQGAACETCLAIEASHRFLIDQAKDRFQDPTSHFLGCVCIFVLVTSLMVIYIETILQPLEMNPKRMGLWLGALLVQVRITLDDKTLKEEEGYNKTPPTKKHQASQREAYYYSGSSKKRLNATDYGGRRKCQEQIDQGWKTPYLIIFPAPGYRGSNFSMVWLSIGVLVAGAAAVLMLVQVQVLAVDRCFGFALDRRFDFVGAAAVPVQALALDRRFGFAGAAAMLMQMQVLALDEPFGLADAAAVLMLVLDRRFVLLVLVLVLDRRFVWPVLAPLVQAQALDRRLVFASCQG